MANTSVKFAGGTSVKDARILSNEMRCDPAFIEDQDKLSFATFVKGTTKTAVSVRIPYGEMEQMDQMSGEELRRQREVMRERYAVHYREAEAYTPARQQQGDPYSTDGSAW